MSSAPGPSASLPSRRRSLLLWSVGIALLVVAAIAYTHQNLRRREGARIEAIANVRSAQIAEWLWQNRDKAAFISGSAYITDLFRRGVEPGGEASLALLNNRLVDYRQAMGFDSTLVLDAALRVVSAEVPGQAAVPPALQAAARIALDTGEVRFSDPYAGSEADATWMDIVVPFALTGSPARGATVFRIDLNRFLLPMLRAWPVPSATGESFVVRLQGDKVVGLRGRGVPLPLSDPDLFAARALRGEQAMGKAFAGRDFRGTHVLGVVQPIENHAWFLVSKIDMREVWAETASDAAWIGLAGLLAMAAVVFGGSYTRERRARERIEAERAEAEQRLRTLALLEAIAEGSNDAIYAKDLQGRYLLFNRQARALAGRSAEEVIGGDEAGLFGPEIAPSQRAADAAVIASLQPCHTEGVLQTAAGPRTVRTAHAPLRDADGRLIGVVGIARDVTDSLAAAAEIERYQRGLEDRVAERTRALSDAVAAREASERFTRLVADNIPARIAYWDRDERCVFVNDFFCSWFGQRREALIGRRMSEIHDAGRYASLQPRLRAVLAGQAQQFERADARADGSVATTWTHYVPDLRDGEVRGFFVLASDISELKQAEQRLQLLNRELEAARDKADAANRAKSAFLANMSHEIRTPLNAIIGLTYLAQRDAEDDAQRKRLAKVSDAARHLLVLINGVLDLSKIESGKFVTEQSDFSLDAMLSRTFELVAEPARAKGLELVLDTDHLPDALRGDPTRLSQALLNLLGNAVKFTDRGCVVLRGRLVEEGPEGLRVRFEVADSGAGIAPETLQRLFAPFEQADASTTRRHGGSGLGLAITRQLARLMGGDAGAESTPGVGSVFWITLRLERASGPIAPPRAGAFVPGLRVLLADDLDDARAALGTMLVGLGLQVQAVASGDEAVAALRKETGRFALAVLDWRMPGMDGIETARQLRAIAPDMPCLLVSAHEDDTMHRAARAAGIGAVLLKPVTASMLHDAVIGLLGAATPDAHATAAPAVMDSVARVRAQGAAKVLLAEDNAINQALAVELMSSVGLVVDVAGNGEQALAMVRDRGGYRLVLMDMQMPVMDGLEATRAIRALGDAGRMPIIAMTANAFGEDREACLVAGMDDHLSKPIDAEVFFATLARWLESGRAAPAT